jgi:hypothetical protein
VVYVVRVALRDAVDLFLLSLGDLDEYETVLACAARELAGEVESIPEGKSVAGPIRELRSTISELAKGRTGGDEADDSSDSWAAIGAAAVRDAKGPKPGDEGPRGRRGRPSAG